jgi:YD repeat-containing protein
MSAQQTNAQIDNTTYTYDPAGDITRTVDAEGSTGAQTQSQCFTYDALRELNAAWTATDNCTAPPTTWTAPALMET